MVFLYCLDVLDFSHKDIDKMASKYSDVLPKVFGKWRFLKSTIEDKVFKLEILSKGLLLDNPEIIKDSSNPIYELMSFIHIKYRKNFESISEHDLAEQISYWFYTFILYQRTSSKLSNTKTGTQILQDIFQKDDELKKWYREFFCEAENYYKKKTLHAKEL